MEIRFKKKLLEKCYKDVGLAIRKYGKEVGERYVDRVAVIEQTESIEVLMMLPKLRCHLLRGNYAGRYAVSITGHRRLIFSLEGESREIVLIEEVSKHYDD